MSVKVILIQFIKKLKLFTEGGDSYGERNRVILPALMDTGASAQEFLDVDLANIDLDGSLKLTKQKVANVQFFINLYR
jgi:hypothetical protein